MPACPALAGQAFAGGNLGRILSPRGYGQRHFQPPNQLDGSISTHILQTDNVGGLIVVAPQAFEVGEVEVDRLGL